MINNLHEPCDATTELRIEGWRRTEDNLESGWCGFWWTRNDGRLTIASSRDIEPGGGRTGSWRLSPPLPELCLWSILEWPMEVWVVELSSKGDELGLKDGTVGPELRASMNIGE